MIYLEDLEVGQKAKFGSYAVTREEVIAFASKYDMQPFHLSDDAAAKTHFGRIAASGWHSCAMMMAMLSRHFNETGFPGIGIGVDDLRWLRPVYPGDTLRIESEVVEIRPSRSKPAMGSIRLALTILNQHDAPVMTLTTIMLVARRPSA